MDNFRRREGSADEYVFETNTTSILFAPSGGSLNVAVTSKLNNTAKTFSVFYESDIVTNTSITNNGDGVYTLNISVSSNELQEEPQTGYVTIRQNDSNDTIRIDIIVLADSMYSTLYTYENPIGIYNATVSVYTGLGLRMWSYSGEDKSEAYVEVEDSNSISFHAYIIYGTRKTVGKYFSGASRIINTENGSFLSNDMTQRRIASGIYGPYTHKLNATMDVSAEFTDSVKVNGSKPLYLTLDIKNAYRTVKNYIYPGANYKFSWGNVYATVSIPDLNFTLENELIATSGSYNY